MTHPASAEREAWLAASVVLEGRVLVQTGALALRDGAPGR